MKNLLFFNPNREECVEFMFHLSDRGKGNWLDYPRAGEYWTEEALDCFFEDCFAYAGLDLQWHPIKEMWAVWEYKGDSYVPTHDLFAQ